MKFGQRPNRTCRRTNRALDVSMIARDQRHLASSQERVRVASLPAGGATASRWRIEAASVASREFRRVATRYDKLNFLSAIVLAAIIAFWV
jgi:hypothetical protein